MENASERPGRAPAGARLAARQEGRRSRCGVLAALALAACGSGTSSGKSTARPPRRPPGGTRPGREDARRRRDRRLRSSSASRSSTSTRSSSSPTRSAPRPSRSRSTSIYIDDINAHGGINGRKIVPVYKYYAPLGTAQILPLCTSFAAGRQRVRGRRHVHRLLRRRADLHREAAAARADDVQPDAGDHRQVAARASIVTAGLIPERSASILLELLQKQHTLDGQDGRGPRRHDRVDAS